MSRHLSWEFLSGRLSSGSPSVETISGAPACQLHVEKGGGRLSLIVKVPKAEGEELPSFAEIECRRVGDEVLLSSIRRERFQEFYSFLMAVADRVQLEHQPLVAAIKDAVEAVKALLAARDLLSPEQQLGLWGELSALRGLARRLGWKAALDGWVARAGGAEEHDFSLTAVDLEVKATRSELRRHHISSGSQLRPKPGRRLLLLSYQLTVGGAGGTSLPELVAQIRKEADASCRKQFENSLEATGWDDADAAQYPNRWLLRSEVTVIDAVDLPLIEVSGENANRVTGVSYVVDVAGLGQAAGEDWTWIG